MKTKISLEDALYSNNTLKTARRYSASQRFSRFLRLGAAIDGLAGTNPRQENAWAALQEQRDAAARTIAAGRAGSLSEVFEKLCIWRFDCLEASDSGFIYFDDLFPLSAYFDLRRMVLGESQAAPYDADLASHLQNWSAPDSSYADAQDECKVKQP